MQVHTMACTCLVTHLCSTDAERDIHYIVCPHIDSKHQHLCTRLVEMDAQFVEGITNPNALMRRVSTGRESGIYVINLTHVVSKRRLVQLLQAVENVKDGYRYILRGEGSKYWKIEKCKLVVFCRYAIDRRLLRVPPEYNIEKWREWVA